MAALLTEDSDDPEEIIDVAVPAHGIALETDELGQRSTPSTGSARLEGPARSGTPAAGSFSRACAS